MNKEDMDRLMAPDPETIVDRLRGIYTKNKIPIAGQYKTSPLHHEAAGEIERLNTRLRTSMLLNDLQNTEIVSLKAEVSGLRELLKNKEM